MIRKNPIVILTVVAAMFGPRVECDVTAFGAATQGQDSSEKPVQQMKGIGVAVLAFEAKDPAQPELGLQIADTLEAMLSGQSELRMLNHSQLNNVLRELESNLSGVVETDQAVKVGKLAGARILVIGRAFSLDNRLFITAKLIGTETSLVEGVLVNGDLDSDLADLVMRLDDKVSERLAKVGDKLVAADDALNDPLPALKKKLAKAKRPKLAVVVPERHIIARTEQRLRPPDPACETEIMLVLRQVGAPVRDVLNNDLARWARTTGSQPVQAWPRGLEGVEAASAENEGPE